MPHDWKTMGAGEVFEVGAAAIVRGDQPTVDGALSTLRTRTTKLARRLLAELEDREADARSRDHGEECSSVPAPPRGWEARIAEIARDFQTTTSGDCCVYLVLCWDYRGSGEHSVYVGQTAKEASIRFDEHKARIRSSRAVRSWGVRLLDLAPHLAAMSREEAERIEQALAAALEAEGFTVHGGH